MDYIHVGNVVQPWCGIPLQFFKNSVRVNVFIPHTSVYSFEEIPFIHTTRFRPAFCRNT